MLCLSKGCGAPAPWVAALSLARPPSIRCAGAPLTPNDPAAGLDRVNPKNHLILFGFSRCFAGIRRSGEKPHAKSCCLIAYRRV